MALEHALLDILVFVPSTSAACSTSPTTPVLYNPRLRRLYRIENGIPLMLPRQAVPVPGRGAQPADEVRPARRGHHDHGRPGRCALAGTDLAREPVHGQPGLAHEDDRSGQPGARTGVPARPRRPARNARRPRATRRSAGPPPRMTPFLKAPRAGVVRG